MQGVLHDSAVNGDAICGAFLFLCQRIMATENVCGLPCIPPYMLSGVRVVDVVHSSLCLPKVASDSESSDITCESEDETQFTFFAGASMLTLQRIMLDS